jgi:O-antigen/teichoic acid export membrane protein
LALPAINRDVLLTIAARLAVLLVSVGSGIVTARFLGPHGRGQYYFVTTVAALFVQLGNLGLPTSNIYLVARRRALLGALSANSLVVSVLIGTLLGTFAVAIISNLTPAAERTPGLWWAVVIAPASLFFLLGSNLLVGIGRIGTFNGFQVLGNLLVLLGIVAAGFAGAGPFGFLLGLAMVWSLTAAALGWVLWRHSAGKAWPSLRVFKRGIGYTTKVYIVTLLGALLLKSGVFFVREISGTTSLGYYSIASQLADVIAILPSSVALVLFPELLRRRMSRWRTARQSFAIVAGLLLLGCILAAWLARPGIELVFGSRFAAAVPIFLWMLPSAFFLGSTSILSKYLAASGYPRALVAIWALVFLVMLALSALLVPKYGGVGAAAALSLSHLLLFVLVAILCVRTAKSQLDIQTA